MHLDKQEINRLSREKTFWIGSQANQVADKPIFLLRRVDD
jgi:hypothetical protein